MPPKVKKLLKRSAPVGTAICVGVLLIGIVWYFWRGFAPAYELIFIGTMGTALGVATMWINREDPLD